MFERNDRLLLLLTAAMSMAAVVSACNNGCQVASVTFDLPESSISADTLARLIHSGTPLTIFECRSASQRRDVKIPGARVISEDATVASMAGLLPATNSLIVLYPGIEGGRTASAANELRQHGYLSILEYHAGILGWMTFGYETESDESRLK